jgi:hypothetical protein
MRAQIEFSLTREFQEFMSNVGDLSGDARAIVHGVFIDFHPVWKRMVDFSRTTGITDRFFTYPIWPPGPYDPDDQRAPRAWEEICKSHGKGKAPFVVRICVVPTTSQTLASRRTVDEFARGQPFFAVVEDRPIAELAASTNVEGSYRILATQRGTVGGFLQDQHGNHWGVTCGHVAQNVGTSVAMDINGVAHPNAGTVQHSNFSALPKQTKASVCNQYVNATNLEVDAALFDLASGYVALNTVGQVGIIDQIYDRTQLNSGSTVRMCGALSGAHDYAIGAYGVTCKMQLSGGAAYYCFSSLFEIYAPVVAPAFVPGRLAQAAAPRPLRGDSGAWICFNYSGSSYAYFGNLIAVQGAIGIATFADALKNWGSSNHGLTLAVL